MPAIPVNEILLGIYLGLLAGIFPAFVAFSLGFAFKYFTTVTIPGLGVVALSGAIAGVSGGLMGLLDPQIAESWVGVTAVIVVLMACLWSHSVGDQLGAATPRHFTLARLRESRLSMDLVERVDRYGQFRVRPLGDIEDIEGYPPLTAELHDTIRSDSWRFPTGLTIPEIERRLEEQLLETYDLAEVTVEIDRQGRARIAAAPQAAGLSRRVPSGRRAVSIQTLLPTGLARNDVAEVTLPDRTISGPVMSARTFDAPASEPEPETDAEGADEDETDHEPPPRAPTTTGGAGQVTIAVGRADAEALLAQEFAPITVHAQGTHREYEAIALLQQDNNRFRSVTLGEQSVVVGQTIGEAAIREQYGVIILSIRRGTENILVPRGGTKLVSGDHLIVVGRRGAVRSFAEVAK